jgi:hypothetical protein
MNAGRELDALVAEKVMGWTDIHPCPEDDMREYGEDLWGRQPGSAHNQQNVPYYSTDIAAAWRIFEKMHGHVERRGHPVPGEEWLAQMWFGGQGANAYASTAPLALCLAALAVMDAAVPVSG